jgi:hypothetical protein
MRRREATAETDRGADGQADSDEEVLRLRSGCPSCWIEEHPLIVIPSNVEGSPGAQAEASCMSVCPSAPLSVCPSLLSPIVLERRSSDGSTQGDGLFDV